MLEHTCIPIVGTVVDALACGTASAAPTPRFGVQGADWPGVQSAVHSHRIRSQARVHCTRASVQAPTDDGRRSHQFDGPVAGKVQSVDTLASRGIGIRSPSGHPIRITPTQTEQQNTPQMTVQVERGLDLRLRHWVAVNLNKVSTTWRDTASAIGDVGDEQQDPET
ncbi:hypothetical protein ON010_g10813 [Phytophthora cinnamomi]|nr:hypothetical protein ON010_g10813 [Phytophthora cinnamomi]